MELTDIWSYSTPKAKYFLYGRRRDSSQVTEVLGNEFNGVLVTDFYAAYNAYDGSHQKCWAHLLRDIKDLIKTYDYRKDLVIISNNIKKLFDEGKKIQVGELNLCQRHKKRRELENNLFALVKPYARKDQKDYPFHVLAKRIDKYLDELFVFVLDPSIPATNNAAERDIRHSVISRKISGGTRSVVGTRTKEILTSIFSTWTANGLNPIQECQNLLTNPNYSISTT